jgi:hypothetical protein
MIGVLFYIEAIQGVMIQVLGSRGIIRLSAVGQMPTQEQI